MNSSSPCFALLALICIAAPTIAHAGIVIEANQFLLDAIKANKETPPLAARALALFHLSALNVTSTVADDASLTRARVLGALEEVILWQFPSEAARVGAWVSSSRDLAAHPATFDSDLAQGRAAARSILESRRGDMALAKRKNDEPMPSQLGFPTWSPPAGKTALHPYWGEAETLALEPGDVALLPAPPANSSLIFFSNALETARFGAKKGSAATLSERTGALFWAQNAGSITPPGQWNRIAQDLAKNAQLDLAEESRLFADLNVALFDASILCWRNKYEHRAPRPDATYAAFWPAMGWQPLLTTPPHPEFPSGHSTFSSAAAIVLEFYARGRDLPIQVTSEDVPGEIRTFSSYREAAQEAGWSRIFGGIHFEHSNLAGLNLGESVARGVLRRVKRSD